MPVYNEEQFIRKSLDSLLAQSFKDFELIISNNASTDSTGQICLKYAAKDNRIRYSHYDENLGSNENFNRTFKLSRGKYFLWASGHDLRQEDYISKCLEILEADETVVLCCPKARWINSDGELGVFISGNIDTRGLSSMSQFYKTIWGLGYGFPIYGIIRSCLLKKTGLFPRAIGADIVLLTELSLLGAFAQVSESCLYIRKLSDYGSWEHYILKSFGPEINRRSVWYLYNRWIYEHIRVIARHVRSFRGRYIRMLLVIICILRKYRWILLRLIRNSN